MKILFKFIINFFKSIARRNIIFYVLIMLLFHTLIDVDKAIFKSKLLVLNRLRPEFIIHLSNFSNDHNYINKIELGGFAFYYKKVSDYMPKRADALGLLGFCSYYLGQTNESISSYQKAIEINPNFFWFHYNLGLIYFKEERFEQALESFKMALATKPQQAFEFIRTSRRIYLPMLTRHKGDINVKIKTQLEIAYRRGYALMLLSQHYIKHSKDGPMPPNMNETHLREINSFELQGF